MPKNSNLAKSLAELQSFEKQAKRLALTPTLYKAERAVLQLLNDVGYTQDETQKLVLRQTKAHVGEEAAASLTKLQSDRAFRLASVVLMANRVFGETEKAFMWLRRPNKLLDGKMPISSLETEAGSRAVEDILIRIDHGIAA